MPVEARTLALAGLESVLHEVGRVQRQLNPRLALAGILVGRVNRTVHAQRILAGLRQRYGDLVLDSVVRETVQLSEAAEARLPITAYAPRGPATADFRTVAMELVDRLQGEVRRAAGPGIPHPVRTALGS